MKWLKENYNTEDEMNDIGGCACFIGDEIEITEDD